MVKKISSPETVKNMQINSYLVKISDRNMIRFYLGELKVISLGAKPLDVISRGLRRSFYRVGVLKVKPSKRGIARIIVDWDKVREYLGADYLA
jgi:hypothetical protein